MLNSSRPSFSPGRALLIAAIFWLAAAIVTGATFTNYLQDFDRNGLLMWRDQNLLPKGPAGLNEAIRDLTALGGVFLRNLFAITAVITLFFLRLRNDAFFFFVTVFSGWILNSYLKYLFSRERPDVVPHLIEAGGYSFPSGHSFNAAAIYIATGLIIAVHNRRLWVRKTALGGAVLISLAIAWSRVWLGVHWPTDVITGWLIGAGWAFFISALFYRTPHRY